MDEIEKAAREGKPLTDAMVRDEGLRREQRGGDVGMSDEEYFVAKAEAQQKFKERPRSPEELKLQADVDRRRKKRHRENLERSTTCIKGSDLDTLKPFWSVWTNGREVLRLDPDAVQDLITAHGADALPPEINALIEWMEQLFKKRAAAKSVTFAGKAPFAQVAGNPAINPNASA